MIDLYAAPTSNGMRAKIILDECEAPYRLHPIDMAKGGHRTPEFLKLNPMGLIPVIVDHNPGAGGPVTIAQSIAIMLHVAGKAGRFLPVNDADRPAFNDVLMNIATDMGPTLGAIFGIVRSDQPDNPARKIFDTRFRQYLSVWDERLASQPYCAGNEVTIADFALFPVVLRCTQVTPELMEGFSHIDAWQKRIGDRPGVKKGIDFS
jgi:GST-like protein